MARYRVAVIDDDPDALSLLGEYLELSGFEVVTCGSSMTALARLEPRPPDLILLDIQMPGKDGFQLLAELRAHLRFEEIPVIFVSSLDRPNLKVKGLELGADDFVVKPFNRAELIARVRAALRRSARFRRLAGCLGGDLADVPLPTLLQTLGLAGKTATVRLPLETGDAARTAIGDDPTEDRPFTATIALRRGMFLGARFGGTTGRDALTRLCLLEAGRFETDFDRVDSELEGPPQPIESILLDAVVEIDEVAAVLAAIGGLDVLLTRSTPAAGAVNRHADARFTLRGPTTPRRLLLASDGTLTESAARILAAVQHDELTAASEPRGG